MHDLDLFDACIQDTHGGSMRYYLCHKNQKKISKVINKFIKKEKNFGLDTEKTYLNFNKNISKIRNDLINLLIKLKKQGEKSSWVWSNFKKYYSYKLFWNYA